MMMIVVMKNYNNDIDYNDTMMMMMISMLTAHHPFKETFAPDVWIQCYPLPGFDLNQFELKYLERYLLCWILTLQVVFSPSI